MEVLVALGIFALGLVAVAAVFPTAIAIQSETVRDLAGQRAVINARSTIQAMARSIENPPTPNNRVLSYQHDTNPAQRAGTLRDYTVATNQLTNPSSGRTGFPGRVQPMIDQPINIAPNLLDQFPYSDVEVSPSVATLNAPNSFHNLFNLDVRSYPKNIADTSKRDYYWYPLIQAKDLTGNNPTWMVFLMVMQRRGTEAVPEVRAARVINVLGNNTIQFASSGPATDPHWWDNDADNDGLPDLIQPGDWVLADDGSIFRVVVAERDRITIDSQVPVGAGLNFLYFAVALDRTDPAIPIIKRETRSAIVRIEQFEIVVDKP